MGQLLYSDELFEVLVTSMMSPLRVAALMPPSFLVTDSLICDESNGPMLASRLLVDHTVRWAAGSDLNAIEFFINALQTAGETNLATKVSDACGKGDWMWRLDVPLLTIMALLQSVAESIVFHMNKPFVLIRKVRRPCRLNETMA